ncbi:MAG: spermidine synthase [Hyphomicrobiales bacterium]|jgi:spermidine synthase|nr:spermidine synthase [Hyphomicrobiales bacterium]
MTHGAKMSDKRWLPETLFDDLGFRMTFAVEKVLYEQQTAHQHLVLFEHKHFGKMLMLDGATQVTTRDEFIYHEMMTHVPILAHGAAKNVLIIGGGDCGIAEEVLKHKALKSVVQVEIDESVVAFSKEHFPEFTTAVFRDKRFESVIGDGMKYVAATERRFDVIIVDSTDPVGPGAVLFTREFYAACKRCMAPGGVMVTQNGVPFFQPDELVSSVGMFTSLFADGACYVAAIPTYVGGHMAMGWAAKDRRLRRHAMRTIAARYRKAGSFKTKYWTPEVHVAAFALPRFIAEHVQSAKKR